MGRRMAKKAALLGFLTVALLIRLPGHGARTLPVGGGASWAPARAGFYVVRPGDTLWAIAERLDPRGDPRAIVEQLSAEVGRGPLRVGERVPIP